MDTPFYDAVARASRRGPRFFVPGHKGNPQALPQLAGLLACDLTEIDGLDDLSHPADGGPLAQSQASMARAFGSGASLYSASGSTSCILAMLALFCGRSGAVVAARGCHVAAVRAMALLDITPHWVPLHGGLPQPRDVDTALAQSGAAAVYITTVDYYGRMADVAALAAVCQKHGAALLCDNAHGAYLRFLPQSRHPLDFGADACADSAHKTLPCLTPAALLHLRDGQKAGEARRMLNLFTSTSPAYPVLASLDLAAATLLEAPPDYAACAARLSSLRQAFAAITLPCGDPLRLRVCPPLAGRDAPAFAAAMRQSGVYEEYFDGESLVYMATPANTEGDFTALEQALAAALRATPPAAPSLPAPLADRDAPPLPETVCSVRDAFFAKERETLPTQSAIGRVMADLTAPCPPGVPLLVPGERVDAPHAALLAAGGILQVDVLK